MTSLVRSQDNPGWGPLVILAAVLWIAPGLVGGLLLALSRLVIAGVGPLGDLWAIAAILTLSPMFSWMGWVLALPAAWWLSRKGWFGWLPAAATGYVSGLLAGQVMGGEVAPWFGLVSLILLRALLPPVTRRLTRPAP